MIQIIAGHRATENRLRYYDRLGRFPDGVVAVGDAVCAFNPVYAQGMTAAALGAEVLDRWLREESHRGRGRGRLFQHRLARPTAAAWQLSAGADYRFRTMEGPPQGRVARLTGTYIAGVMRASTRLPWVRRRLEEVLHLLRPPSALFGPGVLARLAWDRLAGKFGAGSQRGGSAGRGRRRLATAAMESNFLPSGPSRKGVEHERNVPVAATRREANHSRMSPWRRSPHTSASRITAGSGITSSFAYEPPRRRICLLLPFRHLRPPTRRPGPQPCGASPTS